MTDIDLSKYLIDSLNNEMWQDLYDTLSIELNLLKTEIFSKLDNFHRLRTQDDADILISILDSYRYTPYREIDSSIDYLKRLIRLISYRVLYRAMTAGYRFIFSLAGTNGQSYTCYYEEGYLYRNLNLYLLELQYNESINNVTIPSDTFKTVSTYPSELDSGEYTLDYGTDPEAFTLDGVQRSLTHHIIIEHTIDRLFTKENIEYSITKELMEYLFSETQYTRKAIDFPHIGFQNSIKIENSGFTNTLSGDTQYYNPEIKSQVCAIIPGYNFSAIDYASLNVTLGNEYKGCLVQEYPDLNNDVIGHWGFDDIANTTTFDDYSTNNYSGNIAGTVTSIKQNINLVGSSLYLNGVDNTAIATGISLTNTSQCFSVWTKCICSDLTIVSDILVAELTTGTKYISLYFKPLTSQIEIRYDSGSDPLTLTYDIADYITFINQSHLISINRNNSTGSLELYIDGVFIDSIAMSIIDFTGSYTLNISTGATKYKGYIDDIRLYDRVLTSDEINYLYISRLGSTSYINEISETYNSFVESIEDFATHVSVVIRLEFQYEITDLIYIKEFMLDYLGTDIVYGNFQQIEMTGLNHFSLQFLFLKV